jgi:2-dehydro-3-deoxyphosphogluconate aldolase / (4S)-4-hydroxy-2-oxoglutarate aldolase
MEGDMSSEGSNTEKALRDGGIIAIVRGNYSVERLESVGDTLAGAGIRAMEITLNSTNATAGIGALRRTLGDRVLVGAGTVRTSADVELAIEAGAQFLVSPCFDAASVSRSVAAGIPHLPGVFTATEAQAAFAAGCRLVKLFPADLLGPRYLKALRAPLDDIGFVPTGGIDVDDIGDYVHAGAVAFGVGSSLVAGPDQEPAELAKRATRFVRALREARAGV